MMKKFILAAAAIALLAQPALADVAIGVVNVGKILQDSKGAASVRNQMQAKQKAFQAEFDAKEKSLIAEDQSLLKEKNSIEKDALDKKVKALREKAASVQREGQDKKAQLDKAFASSLDEIQKNVLEVVKRVAAEKKLNLVVSSAQVLYTEQSYDITDEVLKRLDAKLPNVAVKF